MLVEFRVGNYRSFREKQTLSLVANNNTELANNCVDQGKLHLLKTAGIYGPNASGKSNLIQALSIMQQIIAESAKPGEKLPVTPFKLDSNYLAKPSSFEVIFYHKDIRYQYGFTATSEQICDEWLYAYPKGRTQIWFERKLNEETKKTKWNFGSYLKGEREKLKSRTINNVLLLSVGAQWNNKQLTTIYEWFSEKIRIILPSERSPEITLNMLMGDNKDKRWNTFCDDYINYMMQCADFGIHKIKLGKEEINTDEIEFPPKMSEKKRQKILKAINVRVEFVHKIETTGEEISFSPLEESDGTKRFFELAGPCLLAILNHQTLLIDELESHLHPLLVRELIGLIHNAEIKKSGTQLVFATHDVTLLDPELFRRDQIWFTEKAKSGNTQLYSMSDYKERKPRKGEAMQKGYLAGRYGAIPILEAFSIPNG